jgi:hypothetical protein
MTDHPLSPWRRTQLPGEPRKSLIRWPCLLPSIAVAVAPLRNLSGDAEQQCLVEVLTDRLVADLFRHCRGFSFAWVAGERRWAANLARPNPSELKYVVSGSVQRGGPQRMLPFAPPPPLPVTRPSHPAPARGEPPRLHHLGCGTRDQ